MTEKEWRAQAEQIPLPLLRTELYEQFRSMLKLRDLGVDDDCYGWVEEKEALFLQEFEKSEAEPSDNELTRLAELFSSEGVEAWLEAFELFTEGAAEEQVLEAAQRGQRYLTIVQRMASGAS